MAFKIGNYTIETQEVYNALIQANVTDNENLAKIDKNNDKVISEDELVEVMVEDSDSTGQKKRYNNQFQ